MRLALALLWVCSTASAEDALCSQGVRTALSVQALGRPQKQWTELAAPRERLILREGTREVMHVDSDEGRWMCLGFSSKRGHLVGLQRELGSAVLMGSLSYVGERALSPRDSAFTLGGYGAYAALASSDGHYVAFVGGRKGEVSLMLLDTQRDEVRTLGPAPAPPPGGTCRGAFDWSLECVSGYVQLESSVWSFERDVLVVSYGADTPKQRAKQRQVRRYKL